MTSVMCPECGAAVRVSERKGMPGWAIGCIVGVVVIPIIVGVVGILAAIAVPSFIRARDTSQFNTCMANLSMIESAKELAALEHPTLQPGDAIPPEMINPFLRGGLEGYSCPLGGQYTINSVGREPECSEHGTLSNALIRRE